MKEKDLAEKSKVYFSHRRGLKICPRVAKDGPLDSILTFRFSRITNWLGHYALFLYGIILDAAVRKNVREAFGEIDPAWGFEPSPSLSNGVSAMMINDHMIALIREGKVSPVTGVKRVTGPKEVELTDGRTLKDIDVIIACTGYKPCNHIVEGLSYTTLDDRVGPLPDLYQNMFPITHADSLVFLDYCVISENAATYREIMAMAVAQIWAGKSKLPSADKMQADVREYQRWFTTKKLDWSATTPGLGRAHTFLRFIHDAAGTGTDEYLGWGWKGWKLWWTDRKLYNLAAWGLYSPHIYRIFETGKRPVWSGAREALLRINEIYRKDWGKGGKMKAERSQGVCTE
jgi:dimethylaniline monooxygenase (N-oxide forming)